MPENPRSAGNGRVWWWTCGLGSLLTAALCGLDIAAQETIAPTTVKLC